MIVDELAPKPIVRVHFKLSSINLVSINSGCYVLATFDNKILYIGLAKNINNRFKQHLENPNKTKPTKEGKAIWFYFMEYEESNLPKLERTWINQFKIKHSTLPILNKVNSPLS